MQQCLAHPDAEIKELLLIDPPYVAEELVETYERQEPRTHIPDFLANEEMMPQIVPSKFAECSSLKETIAKIRRDYF
jgi:hypothetical protein